MRQFTGGAMAMLIEATGIDAVCQALAGTCSTHLLHVPEGPAYLRIEQEQLAESVLHHVTFSMECGIDAAPASTCYFGQLVSGNIRFSRDGGGWDSRRYGPGDVFLCHPPDIPCHGDIAGADLEYAGLGPDLLGQVASTAPSRRPEPIRFTGYQPATSRDSRQWLAAFAFVRDEVRATPGAAHPLVAGAAARLLASAALSVFPNNAVADPTIEDRHDAHPDAPPCHHLHRRERAPRHHHGRHRRRRVRHHPRCPACLPAP
jgi:hypothetical protein